MRLKDYLCLVYQCCRKSLLYHFDAQSYFDCSCNSPHRENVSEVVSLGDHRKSDLDIIF